MTYFSRIDASNWTVVRAETVGQSEKLWIRAPDADNTPSNHWLFKPVTFHGAGVRQGGDWAEKAASAIADLIGVPSADVELASRGGNEGCMSRNVRTADWDMHTGRLWLDANPDVSYADSRARLSQRRDGASEGHTLEAIRQALEDVAPPPSFTVPAMDAMDVFVGMMMLDALIANRDRHEENWAVLVPSLGSGTARLSPAYDQEGSLGYQLDDSYRSAVLSGARAGGVVGWAEKGTAWRYSVPQGAPEVSLVTAALRAGMDRSPTVLEFWMDRVESLSRDALTDLFSRFDGMSDVSRRFAVEVVMTNQERIRNEYRTIVA